MREETGRKCVIFDMDGVVMDSARLEMFGWRIVAEEEGLPDIESYYGDSLGKNPKEVSDVFQRHYGFDGFERLNARVYEKMRDQYVDGHIPLRAGALETLELLKANGVGIGLATGTESDTVYDLLEANQVKS